VRILRERSLSTIKATKIKEENREMATEKAYKYPFTTAIREFREADKGTLTALSTITSK
jgi:hypothetical protein